MTDERKDKLLGEALSWVCEHVSDDEDLYLALHDIIGMTDDEIEECGIDYLGEYMNHSGPQIGGM